MLLIKKKKLKIKLINQLIHQDRKVPGIKMDLEIKMEKMHQMEKADLVAKTIHQIKILRMSHQNHPLKMFWINYPKMH